MAKHIQTNRMERAECVMTWLLYLTAAAPTTTTDGQWMEGERNQEEIN